jgi:hypothetical protein
MESATRERYEEACKKLEEAIKVLDEDGMYDAATHAHHCLELVRDTLREPKVPPKGYRARSVIRL